MNSRQQLTANRYWELRKACLPLIEHYHKDLLVHDRRALRIYRGASVTYTTHLGNRRFGGVMPTEDRDIVNGKVMVQLSNACLLLDAAILQPCPEVRCPVTADHNETYANA